MNKERLAVGTINRRSCIETLETSFYRGVSAWDGARPTQGTAAAYYSQRCFPFLYIRITVGACRAAG